MTTSEIAMGSAGDAAGRAPLLRIQNIAKSFGKDVVLRHISLDVTEGEFLTILGESGSGKTTLLRIIAGFESASAGEVWMGEERLDRQPPYRRRVNTVFQHYALFPHLTVEQNVAYGLRVMKRPEAETTSRVSEGAGQNKDVGIREDEAVQNQRRAAAARGTRAGAGESSTAVAAG